MIDRIRKFFAKAFIKFKPRSTYNNWSLHPISRSFGLDRGKPIDRFYIDIFLEHHSYLIRGICCEISEDTYLRRYGVGVTDYLVFDFDRTNVKATIFGDLADPSALPENALDCFVLTQTLNFIFDIKSAVKGIHRMLKHNGVALVTVAGISQISRYDMERWGDFWRFTILSILTLFEEVFGKDNVDAQSYGNVLSAKSFLDGLCAEELTLEELLHVDPDYQIVITLKAFKR